MVKKFGIIISADPHAFSHLQNTVHYSGEYLVVQSPISYSSEVPVIIIMSMYHISLLCENTIM